MSMELLAAPFLAASAGGFYSPQDAARARVEHLEGILRFWPYMAVVDAFQHWAYTHPDAAAVPAECDAAWADLWRRFMPGVDWSGLEDELADGWRQKTHIFQTPLYYVEYGLAQLGAVQVGVPCDLRGSIYLLFATGRCRLARCPAQTSAGEWKFTIPAAIDIDDA